MAGKAVKFVLKFCSPFPVIPQSLDITSSQHPLCGEAPAEDKGQPVCSYFKRLGRKTRITKPCKTTFWGGLPLKIASIPGCLANSLCFVYHIKNKRCFTPLLAGGTNNGCIEKKKKTVKLTVKLKSHTKNKREAIVQCVKTTPTHYIEIVQDQCVQNQLANGGPPCCISTYENPPITPLPW